MEKFNSLDFINNLSECEVFSKLFSSNHIITDLFIMLDDIDDCNVDKIASIIDKILRKIKLSKEELWILYPIFIRTEVFDMFFMWFINLFSWRLCLDNAEKKTINNVEWVFDFDDIALLKSYFENILSKFFSRYIDNMVSTDLLNETKKNIFTILNC